MSAFETNSTPNTLYTLYRPLRSTQEVPRLWWKYVIRATMFKMRCETRSELWVVVAAKSANKLQKLREILKINPNQFIDESMLSKIFDPHQLVELNSFERELSRLKAENLALKTIVATMLSPSTIGGQTDKEVSMCDLCLSSVVRCKSTENCRSSVELNNSTSNSVSSGATTSDVYSLASCSVFSTICSTKGGGNVAMSPYASPVSVLNKSSRRATDIHSGGANRPIKSTTRSTALHRHSVAKFPSYAEKERARKDFAAKSRNSLIMMKAEALVAAAEATTFPEHLTNVDAEDHQDQDQEERAATDFPRRLSDLSLMTMSAAGTDCNVELQNTDTTATAVIANAAVGKKNESKVLTPRSKKSKVHPIVQATDLNRSERVAFEIIAKAKHKGLDFAPEKHTSAALSPVERALVKSPFSKPVMRSPRVSPNQSASSKHSSDSERPMVF